MVYFRKPQFYPGSSVVTPAALDAIETASTDTTEIRERHVTGDWEDLCQLDCQRLWVGPPTLPARTGLATR